MKTYSLGHWRDYFRGADADIFEIINQAIMVAASDCPKEFKLRRDGIAELLFSCKMSRCTGCDRVELAVPGDTENCRGRKSSGFDGDEGHRDDDDDDDDDEFEAGGSKESKANSSRGDNQVELNVNNQMVSNYSYGEAEALTDELEEASQIVQEVMRIKEILQNSQDQSNSLLFESLRRLQLMALSVDILKATEIGKAVYGLRKHGSERIRQLAKTLVDEWMDLVDQWMRATKEIAAAEGTPDSVNPSVLDEEEDEDEGLPSPPLDEGAFFTTEPTGIELSQFFDGMDDDGNPRNSGEFNENRETGRKLSAERQNIVKRKEQPSNVLNVVPKDNKGPVIKKQEAQIKPNKPSDIPRMPLKPSVEQKVKSEPKLVEKPEKMTVQKKPLGGQQDKLKYLDEDAKLEAAKRKLQERYQQHENAKKQRTIQVVELRDLPKQGMSQRNQQFRGGNHNRNWANGRR